ncbi:pantoate--beta-alanine ligase [Roseomonas sp. OT10]|uniref:pantoate--beta-alanine ligase n=1 Tax=Roseomonas cutis TaxID=2897332 RepID=UPI001E2F718F|nr:pantoate--beta-alanine ligase [Roseomonas sp. OT10]UFN51231.1 pantoate--beta-alanine ligase [Roseomonas sp. OT10]
MRIVRDLPALREATAALKAAAPPGRPRLALVPTMGALHDGHLALLAAARAAASASMASIFVNPLQFGPQEDLSRYPRTEADDLSALSAGGCDLAWLPGVADLYPPGSATTIDVAGPAEGWEGEHRPHHFRGVATVCAKLFLFTGAELAFFGEKDWQQLQVVRRLVRDLGLPLEIRGVPTVREPDGLALSSRNRFLTPEERRRAPVLHAALQRAAGRIAAGEAVAPALAEGDAALRAAGFAPDYLALVDAETLRPLEVPDAARPARLLAAARLGSVRLLDNLGVGRHAPG